MKSTNEIFKEVLIDLGFANHKPSELSNSDYWMATEKAMEIYAEQFKTKADKWDKLDDEIGAFYNEETYDAENDCDFDESEGDLGSIGEVAAIAFGYL